jgi:hypothetical protein
MFNHKRTVQHGRVIGTFFRAVARKTVPIVKVVGNHIIKSPITKEILSEVKDSVIEAGLDIASDALQGKNIKQSIKSNISLADKNVRKNLISNIKKRKIGDVIHSREKKSKKSVEKNKYVSKKSKTRSIFD